MAEAYHGTPLHNVMRVAREGLRPRRPHWSAHRGSEAIWLALDLYLAEEAGAVGGFSRPESLKTALPKSARRNPAFLARQLEGALYRTLALRGSGYEPSHPSSVGRLFDKAVGSLLKSGLGSATHDVEKLIQKVAIEDVKAYARARRGIGENLPGAAAQEVVEKFGTLPKSRGYINKPFTSIVLGVPEKAISGRLHPETAKRALMALAGFPREGLPSSVVHSLWLREKLGGLPPGERWAVASRMSTEPGGRALLEGAAKRGQLLKSLQAVGEGEVSLSRSVPPSEVFVKGVFGAQHPVVGRGVQGLLRSGKGPVGVRELAKLLGRLKAPGLVLLALLPLLGAGSLSRDEGQEAA